MDSTEIKRFIDPELFDDTLVAQLRNLYFKICQDNQIENPKWNMQFRLENKIVLYRCQTGNGLLSIKLKSNKSFRLSLSKSLMDKCKSEKKEVLKVNHPITKLYEVLANNIDYFGELIDKNVKNGPEERKQEFYIASKLERNENAFVIDIEIVKVGDKGLGREGDALLLIKNNKGRYDFLPIEFKIAGKDKARTAGEQVKKLAEKVNEAHKNYEILCNQKQQIGMIVENEKISIEDEIRKLLVVELNNENKNLEISLECIKENENIYKLICSTNYFIGLEWVEELMNY